MNTLPFQQRVAAISALVDGCSLRTAHRLTGIHRDTIGRLALSVGEGCARLHDRMFRDLRVTHLELDEQWSYVHTKQGHLAVEDPAEWGDAWSFIALAVASRAIVSYLVGKRTAENAQAFVRDVRMRVLGAPQITADGFRPYVDAVEFAFGTEVAFGQFVKLYSNDEKGEHFSRYKGAEKVRIIGKPHYDTMGTSYIERSNLSARMSTRRLTRKCNGFSKKLRHHEAAISLWVGFYNLVRVHETLRTTPAMALGVTDHVWTVGELVEQATRAGAAPTTPLTDPTPDPLPRNSKWHGVPADRIPTGGVGTGRTVRGFTVIDGGKK